MKLQALFTGAARHGQLLETHEEDSPVPSVNVPHDDFREGFIVGFQTIKGVNAPIPGIPGQPGTPGNMTPFLLGVKAGIEIAGGPKL